MPTDERPDYWPRSLCRVRILAGVHNRLRLVTRLASMRQSMSADVRISLEVQAPKGCTVRDSSRVSVQAALGKWTRVSDTSWHEGPDLSAFPAAARMFILVVIRLI